MTALPVWAQQVVLTDDFENEDLTTWSGDVEDFTFVEENGNMLLRLDNEDASGTANRSQLRIPSNTIYGEWEFYYRPNANPTNTNRTFFFLVADTENLNIFTPDNSSVSGYAIRTGVSGDSVFELIKVNNGVQGNVIIQSNTVIRHGTGYRVRITRNEVGEWQIFVAEGINNLPLEDSPIGVDNEFTESSWFGLLVAYSSGNSNNFYFDDIIISAETSDFLIQDIEVVSANQIDLTFTNNIDETTVNEFDFSVNNDVDTPVEVTVESLNRLKLTFSNAFPDGDYTVTINDIDDLFGQTIEPNTEINFTVVNPFDVTSIETVNTSRIAVEFTEEPDEASWSWADFEITPDRGGSSVIPESLVYDETETPNTLFLDLTDPLPLGDYLIEIDNNGTSRNGWPIAGDRSFNFTLENPFYVTDFDALSRTEFEITFSQDVQTVHESNFVISGFGPPNSLQKPASDVVRIVYNNPVDVGERELLINNIMSDQGWEVEANTTIEFSLFDTFTDGDLVISEFFYRVPTSWRTSQFNRPQYVEIYNRSDKLLNLRDFTITGNNISESSDLPLGPGEYIVITRGVPVFEQRFGDRNFVEADNFPTLNLTTTSTIEFATDQGDVIETLTYDATLWGGNEVSLERFDIEVSSEFRDNWAESDDVLTGSPGLPNTVTAPTNPPQAISAEFIAPRLLEITFSRTLSEVSKQNLSSYSLDNGALLTDVNETDNPRTLEFELADRLDDQLEYTFSYQNIEDIFGNNILGIGSFTFTFINPFRILAATVENGNELVVQFTLSLTESSIDKSDFELNDGTSPTSFKVDNSEVVRLTFAEPFQTGRFELIVNNVESFVPGFSEHWFIEEDSIMEFFRFDEYQPGDIVLNEFMYRPPSGYPKYVELKNVSNKFLSLKDFELRRASGASSNGGVISEFDIPIEPDGFIVVTQNRSLLENIFGSGTWFQMDAFPGYTLTTADQIRFIDSDENLVEAIDYDPSAWGGNGVALERKSTDAPANDINNWGQSLAELSGTPGLENSVGPDDGPQLLSVRFIDGETVRVTFTGSLDFTSISVSNFSINRGLSVQGIESVDGSNIDLTLDQSMNSGTSYTIIVTEIPDIFGNELASDRISFTYYFVQEAEPGDILISEFMYNEPDGYSEYIELYNSSNKVVDLSGWQQVNDTGSRNILTEEQTFLTPDSYIVLLRNLNILEFFPDIPHLHVGSSLSALKNGGDEIVITTADNVTLDSLRYTSGWGGNGVSLERRDFNASTTDQNNWAESLAPLLGTPGRQNSVDIDQEGPQLIGADFFDEQTVLVELAGAIDRDATSRGNFSINGGRSVSSINFTVGGDLLLTLDGSMTSGKEYTVSVSNLLDIFGNQLHSGQTSFTYYTIEEAKPGDVVINEFMYNEPEDYTRYIELYNPSDKAINIAGWQQANDTGTRRLLTTERVILAPGGYIVLLPNFNLLSIFPDISALNVGSGLSALKNTGDNIVIANAEDVIIDSLTYRPDWGGDGVALERRRANRSSLYSENWANSLHEKFGTPGRENEVERDFELLIVSVESVSPHEVHIEFNTEIHSNSAVRENFITEGIRPETVILEEERRVILQFSSSLQTGPRELSINNIQTIGGFPIAENTKIEFTVYDRFEHGDILVNEFMYRPPSDYPRYVELFNRSNKLLNLKNWRLQRRQTTGQTHRFISVEDLLIEPGDFLVITDDTDLFIDAYGERNALEMERFPSFTLTVDDQIRLFTNLDTRADSLAYNPSTWGGDGVALERLSIDVATELRANWAESPSQTFGSPGLPNDSQPEVDPPQIVRASQFEDLGFRLVFNKPLDANSAMNRSNYAIEPSLNLTMIGFDEDEVILFVDEELENDREYMISIRGLTDLFGYEMDPVTITMRYLEFGEAEPGDLVINEILYRRQQAGSPEFIELYNLTDVNIDLSGWLLADDSGNTAIPEGVAIRENDYVVFTDTESFATQSEKIIFLSGFQSLSNTGDAVVLKTPAEITVDSLYYQPNWGDNITGISLERKDPYGLSVDPANWAPSVDDRGSTPAELNSRFQPDDQAPSIRFANLVHPDSVLVLFDEFINLGDINGEAPLVALQSGTIPNKLHETRFLLNGSQTDILDYDPNYGNRVILDGTIVSPGEGIVVTVETLVDFTGNSRSEESHPVSQPIASGHLVINEIMFNPITDNRDGLPDQSDYIEIYNRMNYAVSLEGIYLHDEPDENNDVTTIDPISSEAKWIPAKGYALFYPESGNVSFSSSRISLFFDISEDLEPFSMQTNRTTLSLPIAGRKVFLADSSRNVIDMVDYNEAWHNPSIIDTRGIALERVNPNLDSNNPENWGSNALPQGGSPGVENSIFQVSEIPIDETGVFLEPNPFSPDDDGFDDNLLINYKLEESDYLLRVRIYDRYGRLVRKLADGQPAGFEGSIIWDGRTDAGLKNRIGIYIVLVEAFNSTNGKNRTFKETAVIARQF